MATRVTICTVLPEPVGCSTRTSSVARQTSVTNLTWYSRSFLMVGSMLHNPIGLAFCLETIVQIRGVQMSGIFLRVYQLLPLVGYGVVGPFPALATRKVIGLARPR